MAFCLGNLLRIIKEYEVDQSKTDFEFVNEFLGCACNLIEPHYFEKSAVSKILACKQNPPSKLRRRSGDKKFREQLSNNLFDYVAENLQQNCLSELSIEIMSLFNKKSKSQMTVLKRLQECSLNSVTGKENSALENHMLATYLSFALIEAFKITNVVDTSRIIKKHGNSCLSLISGDIFRFGFNRKSKDKNIIVIPVNTMFDAHISREEIIDVLKSLNQFYDRNGQGQDMYLPLIGTGMSRAGLSDQESFDLISKIFEPKNNSFTGKVTIVVLNDVFETLELKDHRNAL